MTTMILDHRSVPLEVLREFARSQAELSSVRYIADDAAISRSTMHKFITTESHPHPRVRRLLGLWYLRRREGLNEIEMIRPFVSALGVLLVEVPDELHGQVVSEILDSVVRACTVKVQEAPRWVAALRRRDRLWIARGPREDFAPETEANRVDDLSDILIHPPAFV